MFAWKCVKHDRTSAENFKYPAVGETVRHLTPNLYGVLNPGAYLHGCMAGGKFTDSILYRPGGIWLLIDLSEYPYYKGYVDPDHVVFKEAKVVAEFNKFSDLLARPEMKGQEGYVRRTEHQFTIGRYTFADEGLCDRSYTTFAYGPDGVQSHNIVMASGPNGYIVFNGKAGIMGKDIDAYGEALKPYTWYTMQAGHWIIYRPMV